MNPVTGLIHFSAAFNGAFEVHFFWDQFVHLITYTGSIQDHADQN